MAGPIKFRDFDKIDYSHEYEAEIQRADEFYNKTKCILDGMEEPEGGFFGFFNYYLSDRPIVEEQVNLYEREIIELKSDLEAAVKEIKKLKELLEKRDLTEEEIKDLLNNEKEFIVTQQKLTALKIAVLNRFNQLPSLDVIISDQDLKVDDFEKRYTSLVQEIKEVQKLINAIVHPPKPKPILTGLDKEVQKFRSDFSKAFHETMDFYADVKGKAGSSEAKVMGKEITGEYKKLMERQQELGNAQTKEDFDSLKYPYHTALQEFEFKLMDVLFSRRGNRDIMRSMQELGKRLRERRKLLIELRGEEAEEYFFLGDIESVAVSTTEQVKEVWKYKPWARLLTPTSYTDSFKAIVGKSFEQSVSSLRSARDEVNTKLSKTSKQSAEGKALFEQRNALDQARYHVILQRLVDVMGEKQRIYWQWRDRKIKLTDDELNTLLAEIDILQIKWEKTFDKFKDLPKKERSLMAALSGSVFEKLVSTLSLGLYDIKDLGADDYEQMKHYADLGYSPTGNIKEWLNTVKIPENVEPFSYLSGEIFAFLDWAEKYPVTASKMFGDIALTIMIVARHRQDLIDRFQEVVEKQALAVALLAPHGVRELTLPPKRDELKYKALADISRVLPSVFGAGKTFIEEVSEGNIGWKTVINTYKGGLNAALVQKARDLVPVSLSRVAAAGAGALQGKSLHEIIETQGKIQLIQTASLAREAIFKPTNFIKNIGKKLRIWAETMKLASGRELFLRLISQIGAPLLFTTGGFVLLGFAIFGGPVTVAIGTALWMSIVLFGSSITIPWRAGGALNRMFSLTHNKAIQKYESKEEKKIEKKSHKKIKQLIKEAMKSKGKRALEEAGSNYVFELQVHQQLPYTQSQKEVELSDVDEKIIEKLVEEYQNALGDRSCEEPVERFNAIFLLNDVERKAKAQVAKAAEEAGEYLDHVDKQLKGREITHIVCQKMLENWVRPALIEKIADDLAEDAAIGKFPDEKAKLTGLDEFLEEKGVPATAREKLVTLIDERRRKMKKEVTKAA